MKQVNNVLEVLTRYQKYHSQGCERYKIAPVRIGYSREGKAAVYGSNEFYNLQAISVVSPLKRVSSNRENNHGRQSSESSESKLFSKVLRNAIENQEASANLPKADTSYYATGYTKNAMAFMTIYQTREYSFNS